MAASLNPALRDFWTPPGYRNRVLYGGRFSSKTWDAAGMAIYLAHNYRAKFMCTRQFQNRIEDSVYSVLVRTIDRFDLREHFAIGKSTIECPATGSEFLFYGRARNIEEIKGTDSVDVHWAEECELLTKEEWRVIDPTLREEGSQHWLIFNPKYASDFVYQRFVVNPPPRTLVRQINYPENPFLSNTARELAEAMREEDEEEFRHVYLGEPLSDEDRVVIKRTWIEAAIGAHIKLGLQPSGRRVVGFDVADDGADKCATVSAYGSLITGCEEWKAGEDELMQSCSRVWNLADAERAQIVYDCIGVGAGAGSKFNELNDARGRRIEHVGFNAGGAVFEPDEEYMPGKTNQDQFSNVKAQAWWRLADRFRNTFNAVTKGHSYPVEQMIFIDSNLPQLEKLKTELSTPKRDFDENGRVKVESKKVLAKRKVASPNLADALVMCYAPVESQRRGFFFR